LVNRGRNDPAWQVRRAAILRVHDLAVIHNRIDHDESMEVRQAAVGRLTDVEALRKIATADPAAPLPDELRARAEARLRQLSGPDEPFWDEESQP
jgi:hypothetical protein